MAKEEKALAVQNVSRDEIILGMNTDLSEKTVEERMALFGRLSQAQAGVQIDDNFIGKDLTVTAMTVYQRDYVDQETGEIALASYVAFTLDNGTTFKTASSQAIPFAMQVAKFIGYDPVSGSLPFPIVIQIALQKADTGYKYNFIFKGPAK